MEVLRDRVRFRIGSLECLVISDGTVRLPGTHGPDDVRPNQVDVMCLLIKTAEHMVLIDTGWGVGVGSEPNAGKLAQNLRAEGVQCAEIDTIILSHAHVDHIGGITDAEGNVVFPNARYFMNKKEWEYWASDPDLTQLELPEESIRTGLMAAVRKNLMPIKDQIKLINGDTEIIPGIKLIWAPGHTPGHIVPLISSGTEQLLCTGDLIHHPSELTRPELYRAYNMAPEQTIRTRTRLLSQVLTPNVLVFACHFPFPGLGYIIQKGGVWSWQPLEIE